MDVPIRTWHLTEYKVVSPVSPDTDQENIWLLTPHSSSAPVSACANMISVKVIE